MHNIPIPEKGHRTIIKGTDHSEIMTKLDIIIEELAELIKIEKIALEIQLRGEKLAKAAMDEFNQCENLRDKTG